jgi:hypothetical protein
MAAVIKSAMAAESRSNPPSPAGSNTRQGLAVAVDNAEETGTTSRVLLLALRISLETMMTGRSLVSPACFSALDK